MLRKRWIATGCAVVLAGCFALTKSASAAGDTAPVGSAAPNFTLPSQENLPVSLNDYKGKWVVLYFYPKDQTQGMHDRGPQLPARSEQVRGVECGGARRVAGYDG